MTKLSILIILFFIPVLSFSQPREFTAGVYGGVLIPMADFGNSFKASPTIGLECVHTIIDYDLDFVTDVSYSPLSAKYDNPNLAYYFFQFTPGVRYQFISTYQKFFVEFEAGAYTYGDHYSDSYGNSSSFSKLYFGFNLGFGGSIPLTRKLIFTVKAKIHDVFSNSSFSPTDSYTNFYDITGGLSYRLK